MATVYFGTSRVISGDPMDPNAYTAGITSPSSADSITYGNAIVNDVGIGEASPGSIYQIDHISRGRFSEDAMGDLSQPGRNLLVFLHGFANKFSDAIEYAASNSMWLSKGVPGELSVITWSWPSLGQVVDSAILPQAYLTDQNSARQSGLQLMTFFANLLPLLQNARKQGCKSYLLVHSMGNLALESAIENWFLYGNGGADLFDVTFLAAGDCQYGALNQPNLARMSGLAKLTRKIVIYYSHLDQVLQLSSWVNGGMDRLGQDGPKDRLNATLYPSPPYEMVDATGFQDFPVTFLSSHQYYRRSPSCRTDLVSRL